MLTKQWILIILLAEKIMRVSDIRTRYKTLAGKRISSEAVYACLKTMWKYDLTQKVFRKDKAWWRLNRYGRRYARKLTRNMAEALLYLDQWGSH